ncbi:formylglycine-generating enzyme family protein [Pendulispora rubella]|uniref:Formylglycine-generating enzyme family protein n=1 Tax=Pendulispora rubella TaxID=2741070 RepID=A0ABZ2L4S2_9BACT
MRRRLVLTSLVACSLLGAAGQKPLPAGMVRAPSGAFAIDATLVTRAAFAQFVAATGYVTTAERLGFGMGAREGMDDWEWERMPRASWRKPFREGTPETEGFLADDAPVTLVSWHDAAAFCAHHGKRLPTEAEWEHAMRAGSPGTRFPWGNAPERDGKLGLNFWQGSSHAHNTRADGFLYVSPVRAFPPNAWGIYDPVGNVWQWTADWFTPGHTRVLRGGSWWCGACTCEGYGLVFRGKARPDAAYNNNGFRCAMDLR